MRDIREVTEVVADPVRALIEWLMKGRVGQAESGCGRTGGRRCYVHYPSGKILGCYEPAV